MSSSSRRFYASPGIFLLCECSQQFGLFHLLFVKWLLCYFIGSFIHVWSDAIFTVSLSSLLLLPALFSPVTLLFLPYHLCVWSTELIRVRSKTRVKKSVTIPLTKNSIWSLGPLTNKLETWLFALQFNPRIVTPKECSEVFFCAPYSGPNFWKQYTKICSLEPIV